MKTMILDMLRSLNRNLRKPMNHAPSPCGTFLFVLTIGCCALLPRVHAVSPAPDGCYPNYTTAEGCNALNFLTTGAGNSGLGWYALFSNSTGSFNTGVGGGALALNNADSNTAVGAAALLLNTTGTENVAIGTDAMVFNDNAGFNSAVGAFALFNNTVTQFNVAVGDSALAAFNGTGADDGANTALGSIALGALTTGEQNVAVGRRALEFLTGGSNNVVVGWRAADGLTTGSGNTFLGTQAGINEGPSVDNVICIGTVGDTQPAGQVTPNRCYIGNIVGVTTGGPAPSVNVVIDQDGQLGTIASSARFKTDIKPMDQASEDILKLKPVTFHYKNRDKKSDLTPEFGLIAEDVEQVNRDLVVYGKNGKLWSVRYDAVNAMLLNEFLKEHKKVEEQQANITQLNSKMANQAAIIAEQQKGIELLTAQLKEQAAQIQKVSAQMELNNSAPRTVASDR